MESMFECTSLGMVPSVCAEGPRMLAAVAESWFARDAVILDTETTALDGVAVEIGIIELRSGRVLFDSVIGTDAVVSAEARAVHRITAEEIAGAAPLRARADEVRQILSGRPVLAYNAPFDRGVLARSCRAEGLAPVCLDWQWECVMRYRRAGESSLRYRRLDAAHRAIGDCRATRDLIKQWWSADEDCSVWSAA